MTKQLDITIEDFIKLDWNEMTIYGLNDNQLGSLLKNNTISNKQYTFPKGKSFDKHDHDKAQLIYVIQGELTHIVDSEEYFQQPGDLLVVPKNIPHSAYAGKSEDLIVYAFWKN